MSIAANACVMPHLDCAGNWTSMPVSSSTFSKMQRDLIEKYGSRTEGSSHSGKGTALSWAAKFGVDLQTRLLLGHHSLGTAMSGLTYSRDAQAQPLMCYAPSPPQGDIVLITKGTVGVKGPVGTAGTRLPPLTVASRPAPPSLS